MRHCILLFCLFLPALSYALHDERSLVDALYQESKDPISQNTNLDSLTWLSNMSDKLQKEIRNPFYRVKLLKHIDAEAKRVNLDPQLVLAVIDVESNFNRFAISTAGAQGLMQVMPFWKEINGEISDDLYHPLVNLRYGCTILRHYIDKYSDLTSALAAYNGSLGSSKYPNKVLSRLKKRWQYKADPYSRAPENGLVVKLSQFQ